MSAVTILPRHKSRQPPELEAGRARVERFPELKRLAVRVPGLGRTRGGTRFVGARGEGEVLRRVLGGGEEGWGRVEVEATGSSCSSSILT